MIARYIEPRGVRHRVEVVDGIEQLRIPMRRQWFVILFLPIWLTGWAFGEVSAAGQLTQSFDLFIAAWLIGWTIAGLFAATTLIAQLFGTQTLRVVQRDLEVRMGVGPLRRTWRYRGDAIEHLMAWTPETGLYGMRGMQRPLWLRPRTGAVKFDYGAESIFLAPELDEPEGRVVVDWLARRLPRRATELPA